MSLFAPLKRNARLALKGNWGKSSLILLLYLVVTSTYSVLSTVASRAFVVNPTIFSPSGEYYHTVGDIINAALPQAITFQVTGTFFSFLLLYPFLLGIARWHLTVVKEGGEAFSGVFHFFERPLRYGRSILFSFNMVIRQTFWSVVFLSAPGGVLAATVYFSERFRADADRRMAVYAGIGVILSVLLLLLAVILYAAFMKKYFLTPYLLADDDMTVGMAIKESARLTKGYRFSLLLFDFSFLGWLILSLPLPPLFFYLFPYYNASTAMYAQYIIERKRREETENATREFSVGTPPAEPEDTPEPLDLGTDASYIENTLPPEGSPQDKWPYA